MKKIRTDERKDSTHSTARDCSYMRSSTSSPGRCDYMEHLWKDPVEQMPEMNTLQGTFYVCAQGGGRWPQVVNIWDVGSKGWDSRAADADRLNLKRRKAYYGDWWQEAYTWRTGGFDRLCGNVPGSPSTDEIRGPRD